MLNVLNDIIISLVLSIAIWNNTQNERIQIKDDIVEYVESSQRTYFSLNVRKCFQVFLLTSEKLTWHNKPKVHFVNSRITSTKDILHAKARFHWSNFQSFSSIKVVVPPVFLWHSLDFFFVSSEFSWLQCLTWRTICSSKSIQLARTVLRTLGILRKKFLKI